MQDAAAPQETLLAEHGDMKDHGHHGHHGHRSDGGFSKTTGWFLGILALSGMAAAAFLHVHYTEEVAKRDTLNNQMQELLAATKEEAVRKAAADEVAFTSAKGECDAGMKRLQDKVASVENSLTESEDTTKTLRRELSDSQGELSNANALIQKLEGLNAGLEQEVAKKGQEGKAMAEQIGKHEQDAEALEERIAKKEEEVKGLEEKADDKEQKVKALEEMIAKKEEEGKALAEQVEAVKEELKGASETLSSKEKLITELESEKTACNSKLEEAVASGEAFKKDLAAVKAAKEEEPDAAKEQPEEEAPLQAAVPGEDQDATQEGQEGASNRFSEANPDSQGKEKEEEPVEDAKLDAGADSTEDDALTAALKESKWNADCPPSPRTSEDAAACDPTMSDNADFHNSRTKHLRASCEAGCLFSQAHPLTVAYAYSPDDACYSTEDVAVKACLSSPEHEEFMQWMGGLHASAGNKANGDNEDDEDSLRPWTPVEEVVDPEEEPQPQAEDLDEAQEEAPEAPHKPGSGTEDYAADAAEAVDAAEDVDAADAADAGQDAADVDYNEQEEDDTRPGKRESRRSGPGLFGSRLLGNKKKLFGSRNRRAADGGFSLTAGGLPRR